MTAKKQDFEKRLEGYREVPDRIIEFYTKYPEGRLTRLGEPSIISINVPTFDEDGTKTGEVTKTFIQYTAAAYRTEDDKVPGVGTIWEPFPGQTPYTKDSEMANAETSAWGRALVAIGILSKDEKIASANEVRARSGAPEAPKDAERTADDSPGITLAQVAALTILAADSPQAKGKPEDWATKAVNARLEYYVKKKHANPFAAVEAELLGVVAENSPARAASAALLTGAAAEPSESAGE